MTGHPRNGCACPLRHQHGTVRMYVAHRCRCVRCRSANAAKAAAYRNGTPHPASDRWIDPTGSIRRLRALAAIGVPRAVIAQHLGVSERHVQALRDGVHPRLRRDTADRITAVYELLWDAPARLRSENTRRQAARRGYLPPLAWDDDTIDLILDDVPYLHKPISHLGKALLPVIVDEIAVERAMHGDTGCATRAEVSQAVAILTGMGYSAAQIADRLGVSQRTIVRKRAAA